MRNNVVNVGYDSTNYYVISNPGNAKLLVDCGWPGTMGKLNNQLKRKGIAPSEIRYLLVTHYHPDHAGLTQELRNTGVSLILMETQPPSVQKLKHIMKPDSGYVEIQLQGSSILKFKESRAYLVKIGIPGEVLSTPGHTPDGVSLLLDDGEAFTGDLTHELQLEKNDLTSKQSWRSIWSRGIKTVCPAHGPAIHRQHDI
ncbi:MAG TPA: MBL fold metallo-hydrolase [bacterium]|nr:MBL fold metallo-hydrolase [bacterium]